MAWLPRCGLLLLTAGFVSARAADASPIVYYFSGTVTYFDAHSSDATPLAGLGVAVGVQVTGSFTIDPTTADSLPEPDLGVYEGAVSEAAIQIGSYSAALRTTGLDRDVVVSLGYIDESFPEDSSPDLVFVNMDVVDSPAIADFAPNLDLRFLGPIGQLVLANDAIPSLDLSVLTGSGMLNEGVCSGSACPPYRIEFSIDSLTAVPEPSTAALVLATLGVLAAARRR